MIHGLKLSALLTCVMSCSTAFLPHIIFFSASFANSSVGFGAFNGLSLGKWFLLASLSRQLMHAQGSVITALWMVLE